LNKLKNFSYHFFCVLLDANVVVGVGVVFGGVIVGVGVVFGSVVVGVGVVFGGVINVLVDNLDDELTKTNLYELRQSIINKADKTFNLGYNRPNGGWAFSFSQKTIQKF
jgi:hypothetical protein